MSSNLNVYGKANGRSEEAPSGATRNARRRVVAISLASLLVVAAVICLAVGSFRNGDKEKGKGGRNNIWESTSKMAAVERACSSTLYPEICAYSVSRHPGLPGKAGPMDIVNAAVDVTIKAAENTLRRAKKLSRLAGDGMEHTAFQDCLELFDGTLDELKESLLDLRHLTLETIAEHASDMETLLSAALTNQYTCLDGLSSCNGHLRSHLQSRLQGVSHLVSNSLAMVKNISEEGKRSVPKEDLGHGRRLVSHHTGYAQELMDTADGFPVWLSAADRRLLQASRSDIRPDVVVAKDGSGKYKTIGEAVHAAPEHSATRYVIYVKSGVYNEIVEVHRKKTNLMFLGEGIDATVITGSKSFVDGWTTFHSATVAVTGKGFMARDMTFENTAGASKHQAVALRVGSDLSAFYRCSFKGYQDTLYVHSLRQFYRECNVYGTVDFIFGNAAVVLQTCNLLARRPNENQKNIITAQGRYDPNQNTGISIQNCTVAAAPDLVPVKGSVQTFLGRPWKNYSRTVFMESYLDDLIDPAGWLEWNGNFALSTLYYGEYRNRGPGAGTEKRVKWPGYRMITGAQEASQFTVAEFISGASWLPSTGVKFTAGLMG